ncbi:hypothetical protein Celaphus_00016934, partial [Cervus elaphus hippelaphus]
MPSRLRKIWKLKGHVNHRHSKHWKRPGGQGLLYRVLGKRKLPKQPITLRAKFFSRRNEEKIKR